ncbi:MAG: pyridoxine 5'-phosphate synthase [Saprospiraceae bacterium]|nr:pyridoxine 5'-phosphate synthase [Saprospiraceae bacterium]
MTRLSVNINKVALMRNARGGNLPDLIQIAKDCEQFGAEGITVHPRPDERHIRYADIAPLKAVVETELNMEGNPTEPFLDLVLENLPDQATLVPDLPDALTSDTGWDTVKHSSLLRDIIDRLHEKHIRVSLFVDAVPEMVAGAKEVGADRIEFYSGKYAEAFLTDSADAIRPHVESAQVANDLHIGINAGHDLNLKNLRFYKQHIPYLIEVSIGHALISDALYFGLQNTIQMYLYQLRD